MFRSSFLLLIACSFVAVVLAASAEERTYYCSGTLVTNSDGTVSCVTQVGVASTGYPIFKVVNTNTGVVSYVTQTGVNSLGQPIYSVTNQYGQVLVAPAPAPAPAPATTTTKLPMITPPPTTLPMITPPPTTLPRITPPPTTLPMITPPPTTLPMITPPPTSLPPITPPPTTLPPITPPPTTLPPITPPPTTAAAPASTCSGTLLTNPDGTTSCSVAIGMCPSGYPLYQVTNQSTGTVSYQTQTGISLIGTPVLTASDQYCQPLSG